MITIGILNLQGAVSEHYDITKKAIENMGIEAEAISVRYADEVANCDGVIISGGESTVIGKIIKERGIDKVIKDNRIPVFGTCAGMVLLGKKTDFDQPLLGIMDISVKRNAFGRQVEVQFPFWGKIIWEFSLEHHPLMIMIKPKKILKFYQNWMMK